MSINYSNQLQDLGWRLKLNDTLKGLVKFSAQLQSIRPFFSFKEGAECLCQAFEIVVANVDNLTEKGYVGTLDSKETGLEYVEGCVLFFKEWNEFFTEKIKLHVQ